MEKRIREIHHAEPITTDLDDTLVEWYNHVIEKTVDQLTEGDVARCIRQGIFVESATEAMLGYLLGNPLAGELYEGELMEKAAEADEQVMRKHRNTVREIVESAHIILEQYEWSYDNDGQDKQEFQNAIDLLDKKYLS